MNDYRVLLGAIVNNADLQKIKGQIKTLESKPIKLKIDSSLVDSRIKNIKQELASLGGASGLKLNTGTLEASLDRIATDIRQITTAFGALDSKSGMHNLLTSINQISTALDRASKQFVELNTQLNSLSGKSFGINIGIGSGNAVSRNAAYGMTARGEIIPQLQQQVAALETYLARYYKVADGINGVQKLIQGTNLVTAANHPITLMPQMTDASNLSKQMTALKQYIALIKEAAAVKGIDLTPVTSGFAQSADQLVTKAQNVQSGTAQMQESLRQLQGLFSSGINAEKLSVQLDSIVADLSEIRTVLQGLSQNASIDSLTTSFNNLSASLEKLVGNAAQAQNALNNGLNTSATSASTQKAIQSQQQLAQTTTQTASGVNDVNRAYQELISLQNRIGVKQQAVAKLDTTHNQREIMELSTQIDNLFGRYQRLHSMFAGSFSAGQVDNLNRGFQITSERLGVVNQKVADVRANLAAGIKGNFGNYDAQLITLQNRFNNLTNQTPQLKTAIESVKQALETLKTADGTEAIIAANKEYIAVLEQVKGQLAYIEALEKGQNTSVGLQQGKQQAMINLQGLYEKGSVAAKKFGGEVRNLEARLRTCGTDSGLKQINKDISMLRTRIKQSGLETQTFGTRLKKQLSQYTTYLSGAMLFMYAIQGLRSMFEQVKSIDSAMTELKKVTDETDATYNHFLSNAASKAKELGTTIDGLVSSTADFARLGYGFEDAQGLAEVANIYAVVGDEIKDVEQATKSLISTMAAFKDSAGGMSNSDFAMSIIDKFNEIGNNFAISSGGIGEALERSASSLDAANNTIDESIALITAANTVVQDPQKVGNAFKTISMRIRGAKTELEEAGEDTEGMVESTAKLRQEILALSGVDIMENANEFKSTYAIMDELAQKWASLTDIQQASITELVAGKRQGNIMSSLMTNFDTARDALQTSLKSTGSAMREHEKWQESLEARLNSLKASWQAFAQSFLQSDIVKGLLSALTKVVDILENLIDGFGVLGTTIGGLGLYKLVKNLYPTLVKVVSLIKAAGGNIQRIGTIGAAAGKRISTAFASFGKFLAIMGAIKAVNDIISWMSDAGDEAETTAEKFDRISQELADVDSELSGLESELSNVESQMDALLAKDELTFADKEELSRLRQVSKELEHQIKLTETLQESLQKSLSSTAINAYKDYATDTSFYGTESKEERKEKGKSTGSAIGNIVGLIAGAVIGYYTGGSSYVLAGAGLGSALGSAGGSYAGGNISTANYYDETMVREVLDNMETERASLERARDAAYEAYASNQTSANKKAWEEAATALNDYNAALSKHMTQLSEYYNSIDYASLSTQKEKDKYIQMGDDLDKYNIAMGVVGAKSTAFDRIFSDELITKEAQELRGAIEASLNSGEDIKVGDFNGEQFTGIKERLADMGLTIVDVISYFQDLKVAQEEASNYETYDMVKNVAALSDGVAALTDAFAEFNEQGTVSAKTLAELHEVFGTLGEDWVHYVDVMTNGIATVEDAREATEQLVASYTGNLLKNGGIKFAKFNPEANDGKGGYEFNEDGYKTYLSTINQLEELGVENAKEYLDASQQQAMIREAASQMLKDSAQKEALLAKETLTEKEKTYLSTLKGKELDDYRLEIESKYGVRFKDSRLIQQQYNLNEYQSNLKEYQKYLNDIESLNEGFKSSRQLSEKYWDDQKKFQAEWESYLENGFGTSKGTWKEFPASVGEAAEDVFGSWLGFDVDTEYDKFEKIDQQYQDAIDAAKNERTKREEFFKELVDIAKKSEVDLSDINIDNFDPNDNRENSIFNQVYERVKTELNASVDKYEEDIKGLESEIEARLNNLGLEIDFGRNFDKIIIDGLKGKIEQFNAAQSEMFSSGGLSTDSIIAIDEIFGDLSGYNSSELFENTANGVRLNTEAFEKYSEQFKKVNIGAIEDKMSDLGKTYEETREELNNLTYGTMEYQEKARELEGIGKQIEANEELLSQYKALFSSYQEWQRAESAGSERNMYETILGGFESVGDEISRGWVDEGTREFLELLKGEKATIIDGNGNKKEIDITTASAKELKQVWKDLDDTIKHTTYSVQDFFTVDEDGNSTSQGVYNFLDAIGQMEEEKFGGEDVVKRKNGKIIGFNFQTVGGDEAIAKALGISEELVQIMKRAAIDAGFVVTFDGSFEQLDVLKDRAEKAAKEMNKILKAAGKETIDIDMNVDSVEEIQPQLDKIMETFGKKDGNGKLTGEIDMGIKGADKAIGIARTLQSMLDEITKPAYMDIQAGQVEEELRTPLSKLQELRTYIEQEHQLKLSGGDTSKLEASKQEIYAYFEELDPKIKAQIGLVDAKGNGITEDSFNNLTGEQKIELGYVDEKGKPIEDFSEALQKKLGDGSLSIAATVDLQLEMADALDVLAQTALFEQGLISKEEYTKRVQVYLDAKIDDSGIPEKVLDGLTDEEKEIVLKYVEEGKTLGALTEEEQKVVVKLIGDDSELQGWTPEQKEAMVKYIVDGGEVDGWTPEQKKAYAQYMVDHGDVDGWTPEVKKAFAEYIVNGGNVDNWTPEDKEAFAKYIVDGGDPATYQPPSKTQNVKADLDSSEPDDWQPKPKTMSVWAKFAGWIGKVFNGGNEGEEGGGGVNGTANSSGSSFANGTIGKAYKQGDWRTKKTETALTGELGREIVVTPQNRWYTVGDNGAEFVNIPRGSIIFNHRQTEELLKNGKATSDGGRARALVNGTAFLSGTAHRGEGEWVGVDVSSFKVGYDYNASSDKDSKKSQEIFDWIEVAIKRIEREIDNLDRTANNVYKSWSSRNKALASEIGQVGNEIALQESAYKGYMRAANEIGLSSQWKKKVQSGAIDIDNITNETTAEKVKDYQKWYEKALDCKDAIAELKEEESKLYAQRFENVQAQYDGILQGYEHTETMLNEYIAQAEEQGHIVSTKYYQALINNEKKNINTLKDEQSALIAERDKAVADGKITKYSEEWYNICQEIDGVTEAIEEGTTALIEYDNAIRDIDWQKFDLVQDRMSRINAEADFLVELMSNEKLFDDKGKITDQGLATMGLHTQKYNTYMYQADDLFKEKTNLEEQLAKNPRDGKLEERLNDVTDRYYDAVLAANAEKEAIKDLVEEGINLELDALQELIDKKNESLEAERDLYEYNKKVKEQTEEIASLRKQMAAYEGDNSEESQKRIQELKVSLKEAETELQETEWDKYIQDTEQILTTLYDEYETILNTRLDDINLLLSNIITGVNDNASTIKTTLETEIGEVGGTLSDAMSKIWSGDGGSESPKSIVTMYGNDFQGKLTTVNTVLGQIKTNTDKEQKESDKEADKKIKQNKTSPSSKKDPTKDDTTKKPATTNKQPDTTKKPASNKTGDGKAKVGDKVKFIKGKYYYDSQGKNPAGSKYQGKQVYITKINNAKWATHPYHISTGKKLGSGDLGWLKKSQISGYATGKKKISNSEYAWTQENGQEYIVRPSDGAILTPVAKGDSVLNATASGNIWQMANNPAEFIKDNLNLGGTSVPNGVNVQSNYTQHLDKVVFNLPNVKNYDELLTAMQKDKNFERLILSMSIDRLAGKSGLAKGKSIR